MDVGALVAGRLTPVYLRIGDRIEAGRWVRGARSRRRWPETSSGGLLASTLVTLIGVLCVDYLVERRREARSAGWAAAVAPRGRVLASDPPA